MSEELQDPGRKRPPRTFARLLAEGVRWPAGTARAAPVPRMVSTRYVQMEIPFESRKMPRVVRCESHQERKFYSHLDREKGVLWFQEQPLTLPYRCGGRRRTYSPDTLVALTNGQCFVAEVKPTTGVARFETIRKMNVLVDFADDSGYGTFLGNHYSFVGDFMEEPDPELSDAVLSVCDRGGMTTPEWKAIRERFGGVRATTLNPIVFRERLVVTTEPWLVRRGHALEEREIERFVARFGGGQS